MGSTGTLSALMEKEVKMMQARRSSSVSHNHDIKHCKKSPSSPKNYSHTVYPSYSSIFLPSASPLTSPPSSYTNLVSSLWSDLKSLVVRSPTSLHHHSAHSPLIHAHTNLTPFCQEQLDINYEDYAAVISNKSPPSHPSPPTTLSHPSVKRAHPNKAMPHSRAAPAYIRSPSPKRSTYSKEKVEAEAGLYSSIKPSMDDWKIRKKADYPYWISPLHDRHSQEQSIAGAPDYQNGRSPLHNRSHERLNSPNRDRKSADVYQVVPPPGSDQEIWRSKKGRHAKEQSFARASPAKIYPKGKTMDGKSPDKQSPSCRKADAMNPVYAMRRRAAYSDAHLPQNDKVLHGKKAKLEGARTSAKCRKSCSKIREERANNIHDETCCMESQVQTKEESEYLRRREERECMHREPWKPASSPLNARPSRSFGGHALPLVSVVDIQCCHTPDSSRRSFTRLSSL